MEKRQQKYEKKNKTKYESQNTGYSTESGMLSRYQKCIGIIWILITFNSNRRWNAKENDHIYCILHSDFFSHAFNIHTHAYMCIVYAFRTHKFQNAPTLLCTPLKLTQMDGVDRIILPAFALSVPLCPPVRFSFFIIMLLFYFPLTIW